MTEISGSSLPDPDTNAALPCAETGDDLLAWYRGELEGAALAAVEAHLAGAGCPICGAALEEMRALDRILESPALAPREPSAALRGRLLASLREEEGVTEPTPRPGPGGSLSDPTSRSAGDGRPASDARPLA